MGGQQVASFAFPSCIEIEDVQEEEEEEAPARNTGQTNRGRLWASNLSSRLLFPLAAVRKIRDGKAGGSCAQLRAMADNWVGHPCAPTERGQSQSASGMLRASQLSAERYMHHITAPWKQKFILQAAVGSSFSRVLRNGGCQDSWPLWQATMGGLRGVLPVACSTVAAT